MSVFQLVPRVVPKAGDDAPAKSLLSFLWRMSGHHQIWICILALIVAALSMAPLELQRRIINNAIDSRDIKLLALLGSAYLVLLLVQASLKFILRIYQGWLSESAIRHGREHLIRIHNARHGTLPESEGQGRAVSIIAAEIDKLGGFVGEGLSQPVVNFGMLLFIVGYMLVVQPFVSAVSLLFLFPQILIVPVVQQRLNRLIERRLSLIRGLSDRIVDPQTHENDDNADLIGTQLDQIYGNRITIFLWKFAMKGLVNLFNTLAPLTVLMVGGYFALHGETTIGVVVAFMSGFDRLANPLRELLSYYRVAAQAKVQHQMIARWM